MDEAEHSIGPRRFFAYVIIAGTILFLLEQLIEHITGDSFSQDRLTEWLEGNKTWAWVVILVLWLVQAVLAPLPAPILVMTTAVLYAGTTLGIMFTIVLTWTGSMLGAIICFGLSRHFGRDWVVRKGYLKGMRELDGYLEEKGAYVIFLTRLIPILSFDIVSYAAGLTRLKWRSFIVATGIGMLPTNIIFILFAAEALSQDETGLKIISGVGLVMLAIASYLLVWLMNDYEVWKNEHTEGEENAIDPVGEGG